jgi:hypothetical protein
MGPIYGLGMYNIKDKKGAKDQGVTRLFQILVSNRMLYLIWLMRYMWRIEDELNLMKILQRKTIADRWRLSDNRQSQRGCRTIKS